MLASIGLLFGLISFSLQQEDSSSYWRFNRKLARQYQPLAQSMPKQSGISLPENLIAGIFFDCTGKPTGPNKDPKYCDVFHACVYGQQQKTYACPQIGDRFYFDEASQRFIFICFLMAFTILNVIENVHEFHSWMAFWMLEVVNCFSN